MERERERRINWNRGMTRRSRRSRMPKPQKSEDAHEDTQDAQKDPQDAQPDVQEGAREPEDPQEPPPPQPLPQLLPQLEVEESQQQPQEGVLPEDWAAAMAAASSVTAAAAAAAAYAGLSEVADGGSEEEIGRGAEEHKTKKKKRLRFAPAKQLEQFKVISPVRCAYDDFSPSSSFSNSSSTSSSSFSLSSSAASSVSPGGPSDFGTRRPEDMSLKELTFELTKSMGWIEVQIRAHERFFCARGPADGDHRASSFWS